MRWPGMKLRLWLGRQQMQLKRTPPICDLLCLWAATVSRTTIPSPLSWLTDRHQRSSTKYCNSCVLPDISRWFSREKDGTKNPGWLRDSDALNPEVPKLHFWSVFMAEILDPSYHLRVNLVGKQTYESILTYINTWNLTFLKTLHSRKRSPPTS